VSSVRRLGIHTILPFTILYDGIYCYIAIYRVVDGKHIYCNILRNSVCDDGGTRGAQIKVEFAKNSIDSCTQASQ